MQGARGTLWVNSAGLPMFAAGPWLDRDDALDLGRDLSPRTPESRTLVQANAVEFEMYSR